MTPEPCRYCTRPAVYGMCTFHIMLNSGASLEYCNKIAGSEFFLSYQCPHCYSLIPRSEFCSSCYDLPYPSSLMDVAERTRGRLCPFCLSPKTRRGRTIQWFAPSDCPVCVQNYQRDRVPTHHTPEQLAAWAQAALD